LTTKEEVRIVKSLKGDPSPRNPAFDVIVQTYRRRLKGFIRMRTGSDAEVEDILNEVWFKFWRSVSGIEVSQHGAEHEGVSAFLYRIALTTMVDHYRKKGCGSGKVVLLLDDLNSRDLSMGSFNMGDNSEPIEVAAISASPEELFADWESKEFVLQTAFGKTGRPPHEVLVFGFAVCLGFKPQELASRDVMDRPLRLLERDLEEGMREGSNIPESRLTVIFGPLRDSMTRGVSRDRDYLDLQAAPVVGASVLRDYSVHPESLTSDIRIWRYNVLRRTILLATKRAASRISK
jgi:DNA-directed RNA polymerase specialized sigma24 family protein